MKALFLVPAVAASMMLAACETTESIDERGSPRVASAGNVSGHTGRRVVRMAPIADDYAPAARRVRREPAATAPAETSSKSAAVSAPRSAPAAAESTPAPAASPSEGPATPAPTPAPETTTPAVAEAAPPAPTELSATATPSEATPTPAAETPPQEPGRQITFTTRALTDQIPKLFEAKIAGMPLWLVIVVTVVLLAAIAIGMGSSRKPKEEI